MSHAFLSKRVVTPAGTSPAALLIEDDRIRAIANLSEVPRDFRHPIHAQLHRAWMEN